MLASVSLPTLLGRNFRLGMAFLVIALNLVSNSWRRWSTNGRNTKCRQYISEVSASHRAFVSRSLSLSQQC